MADMTNFKKLTPKQQLDQVEKFISSLPKEKQAEARKRILG